MAFEYQAFATLGVNLNRQKYGPLDISQVFKSQADLDYYLSKGAVTEGVSPEWYTDADNKTVPYPYPGQVVALVIDRAVSILYLVEQEDGTFATEEVGKTLIGDGATIEVVDGKIQLYGVNAVDEDGNAILDPTKKYQPVWVDGKLTWQELAGTTIEEIDVLLKTLDEEVNTAQADIESLKTSSGTLAERVTAIEEDYLKAADKAELKDAIDTAKTEAVAEAVATVLGEGTSEDFDTLKEVADWILSDTTGATALMTRVTTIENDYLKGADKTELQGEIDALEELVGTLPDGAASTTAVAYIQEVIDNLKIGEYSKASELTALAERVSALEAVGAEKNAIKSVDEAEFTVDADRKLAIKAIAMEKVTGLPAALEALQSNANKIEKVTAGGVEVPVDEDKVAAIPMADASTPGVVQGTDAEDGVSVAEDGTMSVNTLNVAKLVQTDGDTLILDGGTAAG